MYMSLKDGIKETNRYIYKCILMKGIVLSSLFSMLLSITGCSQKSTHYQQADVYKNLRDMAFATSASELNITQKENAIVYGVIMETGLPDAVFSLIAFGDGSASLYFSNGGGIIGFGENEKPKQICLDYINYSNDFIKYAKKTDANKLPNNGETVFYFLTFDGLYFYKEKDSLLGNDKSPLSKLFYQAHELIAEAKIIYENEKQVKK